MESTEAVLSGKTKADAAWFANAKYLLSDPQGQARVKLQEKIMLSPITVGVSESAAKKLGWDDPATAEKVTWKTISKAACGRQADLRALQPRHLQPGLHGADGRGGRGERQGRCAGRRRRRPGRDRQLPQGLQAGRRQLDLPGGEVHRRAGPAAQRLHQLRELAADAQQRRQAEGKAGPRLSEGRRLDRRLSVHAAAGRAPRRLPEGGRLSQGQRGADLAGAADLAPADLGRGRWPGRRPVPQGRRHAGRARVLARPAAFRRPDQRLSQRVPPADRLDLRARHQRQHGRRRPARAAGAGDPLHLGRRQLAHRPAGQAHRPRAHLDAAVLRPAARA